MGSDNDQVWHRLDRELKRRRSRHLRPGSWADIARELSTSEQRVNNWKRRGVPSAQHPAIARALGWSVDELLGLSEPEAAASPPPPAPPPEGPRAVSSDDLSILEVIKEAMLTIAQEVQELRGEVAELKASVRGTSMLGELQDESEAGSQKKGQQR